MGRKIVAVPNCWVHGSIRFRPVGSLRASLNVLFSWRGATQRKAGLKYILLTQWALSSRKLGFRRWDYSLTRLFLKNSDLLSCNHSFNFLPPSDYWFMKKSGSLEGGLTSGWLHSPHLYISHWDSPPKTFQLHIQKKKMGCDWASRAVHSPGLSRNHSSSRLLVVSSILQLKICEISTPPIQ